eukprot:scaffold242450_cov22-Prasinocladus_malaysianus.AAC.1
MFGERTKHQNLDAVGRHRLDCPITVMRRRVANANDDPGHPRSQQRPHGRIVSVTVTGLHVEVGSPAAGSGTGLPHRLDLSRLGALQRGRNRTWTYAQSFEREK